MFIAELMKDLGSYGDSAPISTPSPAHGPAWSR